MGAGAHWDGRRHVAAAARAPPGPFGVWQVDVENGPRCSTAFVPDKNGAELESPAECQQPFDRDIVSVPCKAVLKSAITG